MKLREYIKNNFVYLDGGMGTLLQKSGLKPGEYPEHWNISHPEIIQEIHRRYYKAGSNIVSSNTFGANSLKFSLYELELIISKAMENAYIAKNTSDCPQEKFIAIDIGPTGKLLEPFGNLSFEDAVAVFAKTTELGVKYGADLIFIETMNDSYETKAALLAAKENSDLPVFVSNAYSENGKLLTGASPEAMIALLEGMQADAIGINCSFGPDALRPVLDKYLELASVPVLFKPNAGLPIVKNGETLYDILPEEFAESTAKAMSDGVRIAGGCCGTTPEYISAMTKKTANISPLPLSDKNITCVSSRTHAVFFGEKPILIGERINPTGKKRFKQALIENDINYILDEGLEQQEKGVHILDVNVGLPEINEAEMLKQAVCELQTICNLPLQIDTSDASAMECALRKYNGKAMVNSVTGKAQSMHDIFSLVKKYGGLVVALTLDENGIPGTVKGRIEIAKKILKTAKEYGISKKDIIFDPLCMTISTDNKAANATLESLSVIRRELGCHTSLGVSNVSFGLPERNNINSTFFASALEKGLSAAIMNPYSYDMMKTYYSWKALHGMDENCSEYIEFCNNFTQEPVKAAPQQTQQQTDKPHQNLSNQPSSEASALFKAISKGLKTEAGNITAELLKTIQPLEIVQNEIIPALDEVGKGFEEQKIYLPQLLMSAESAKSAFEEIKHFMSSSKTESVKKCSFVIATVYGDIHDIGKNIVKLLLENYGFDVTDLGKNVPPQKIADTVVNLHAPLVGLSALMTTTVPAMEETIKILRQQAPWCKIIVGGAVLNKEYADKIGADKYAKDAMETVRYAEQFVSENL